MSYCPELWCVLKITPKDDKPWYRLFGMWRGGFATSDQWRANSGITKVELEGDLYKVYGMSGSCYECYVDLECLDPPGYFGTVLYGFKQSATEVGVGVEIVPIDQAISALLS